MVFRAFPTAMFAALCAVSVASAQTAASPKTAKSKAGKPDAGTVTRLRYVVAPTGNEARYRVREQLVSFDLPNDAIGATKEVTGTLVVDANGTVVRDSSKITVNVQNLKSDQARRDGFIKRRTMETDKYPIVELTPTLFRGITARPSGTEPMSFEMLGDLMLHGTTRPSSWKVTAHAEGDDIVGSATTAFTFKDFGLEQPKVPVVLSVEDTIKLEYDFRFTPAGKTP